MSLEKFWAIYGTRRSLTYSQQPVTDRHLEPYVSILYHTNPSYSLRPISILSSRIHLILPSSFGVSCQHFGVIFLLSHACYMFQSSHSSFINNPNNIWWVQITKLLIYQFPSDSTYFRSFPTHSPQHPILSTLGLCYFLNVSNQMLQSHKTTRQIIVW